MYGKLGPREVREGHRVYEMTTHVDQIQQPKEICEGSGTQLEVVMAKQGTEPERQAHNDDGEQKMNTILEATGPDPIMSLTKISLWICEMSL